MKRVVNLLSVILIAVVLSGLSGCITSKTPDTNAVTMNVGEQKTFSVWVYPDDATYTWKLDGISLSNAKNSYDYKAKARLGGHVLTVEAKHSSGKTDTQTWYISLNELTAAVNLFNNTWELGFLDLANETGDEVQNSTESRVRTGFVAVKPNTTYTLSTEIQRQPFVTGVLLEYDAEKKFIRRSGARGTLVATTWTTHPNAYFVRWYTSDHVDSTIGNAENAGYFLVEGSVAGGFILFDDTPSTQGVANVLKRAAQMRDIKWTPSSAYLPRSGGDFGEMEQTGLPYSSARVLNKFIGYDVSIGTYMTALANPASKLYTVNLSIPGTEGYNENVTNAFAYYGIVCTVFVGYALDIPIEYTTTQWSAIPGMAHVDEQNANAVKLGDSLVKYSNGKTSTHAMLITGVRRDYTGNIKYIEISEGVPPCVNSAWYSSYYFNNTTLGTNRYAIFRYALIDNATYKASAFVAVADEDNASYHYNTVLSLDYGNMANYKIGEPVEINVMSADAESLVIEKFNANSTVADIYSTYASVSYADIATKMIHDVPYKIHTLNITEAGNYRAHCLMSDGSKSDVMYWRMLKIPTVTVENIENGASASVQKGADIKFIFPGWENCTPLYLSWQDSKHVALSSRMITKDEILWGKVTTKYGKAGTMLFKIIFENEYGRVASHPINVTVTD